jgi:hypothetical protein
MATKPNSADAFPAACWRAHAVVSGRRTVAEMVQYARDMANHLDDPDSFQFTAVGAAVYEEIRGLAMALVGGPGRVSPKLTTDN